MKEKLAELKPFKVGEPLTDNADGNPELSLNDKESVETGRKVCIKCGEEIPPTKYKSAKYCSTKCRQAYGSYKWRVDKGIIKNPGVGSGGNQFGENNHMYDSGQVAYKKRLFRNGKAKICEICQSTKLIEVHHIDRDRKNNLDSNLLVVCKACHRGIHGKWTGKSPKYIKGQPAPQ